uniref:DUF4220 domain-containing protein n=1 Tax=Aegilops tauschii TaxID=37682 RepID=M8C1A5_AEGTA
MSFSGAVQWWDEWQLRILVLGSLFIQYFLFFSSLVRRCALPSWLRLFMWLAYLGGDALAIYALATLFNRHKQLPANGSGLQVLWTPVLLIHLRGQHAMTAYNIEDNELWTRHAITAVSQVTVALYVFCTSWSGEKRLLQAAILLFVVGIIRSIQKPWALKNASISGMVASSSPSTREQGLVARWCGDCISRLGYEFSKSGRQEEAVEEKDIPLEEFIQQASRCVMLSELASDQEKAGKLADDSKENYVYRLLVDISTPYSSRIKILRLLMALDYQHAHRLLNRVLAWSFGFLYTKLTMILSGLGFCLHLLLPFLTLASAILFSTSHKYHDYNATDVKITYILFFCTMHVAGFPIALAWSLDRSLWIYQDLCFHHQNTTPHGQKHAAQSRVISNHMAYLLSIRPEMLMLGTRNGIFTVACDDVELMMGGVLAPDVSGLAQGILQRAQQPPSLQASKIGALVPNACRLAEALMELQDEGERWEVVQGVWVEMLCYSAGRCRGYLHAKNMSEGLELLSDVWCLLSFMGMETSADRYQKPEPPETKEEEEEEEEEDGDHGGEGRSVEHEINISV